MKYFILFLFVNFSFFSKILAQTPFLYHYKGDNIPTFGSVFDINQDKDGIIYVSGSPTLLYNGTNWQSVEGLDNVRSSLLDNDGIMLIGGKNGIGYLENIANGNKKYISLNHLLSEEELKIPTIWRIHQNKEGVFFQSQKFIFQLKKEGKSYKKINSFRAKSNIEFSFLVDEKIYFRDEDIERKQTILCEIVGNDIKTIFEQPTEIKDNFLAELHHILPYQNNTFLFFTRAKGIIAFDIKTKKRNENFKSDEKLKNIRIYDVQVLKNGNIVIGTMDKGLFILNKNLDILYQINDKNGLPNNNVHTIFEDKENNIWVGTGSSLVKILLGVPVEVYNNFQNLKERVYATLEHKGIFYAATNIGTYFWDKKNNTFSLIEGTQFQCWNMESSGEGVLIAGGNKGAFYVENTTLLDYETYPNACFQLLKASQDSTILFVPTYTGVRVTRFYNNTFKNKKFKEIGFIKGSEADCRKIIQTSPNKIWVQSSKGIFTIEFLEGFYTQKALENTKITFHKEGITGKGTVFMQLHKGELLFRNEEFFFKFENNAFLKLNPFQINSKNTDLKPSAFFEDKNQNLWFLNKKIILQKQQNDSYNIDSTTLRFVPANANNLYQYSAETFFIAHTEGIHKFQPKKLLTKIPFVLKIKNIRIGEDSLLNFVDVQKNDFLDLKIPYKDHNLTFQFGALSFLDENKNQIQYKLEGFDENWSHWQKISQKEYTNLLEGNYIFRIRAMNVLGEMSNEIQLKFTILPPYYRTWWAYILYVILAILVIFLLVKNYTYRLQKDKERLENIVKERTNEIQQKNITLEQQKEEIFAIAENLKEVNEELTTQSNIIENKNRHITESINYAKRIQTAMLPFEETIAKTLEHNDFFVFYKPRDVVSGDFYWFAEKENKHIFSVADCTGHGVPGAFMSMIGDGLLNQIVHDREIHEPDLILYNLHKGIRKALNQAETNNHDGMDIMMCKVEKTKKTIDVAGAKNAIFFCVDFQKAEDFDVFFEKNTFLLENERIKIYYFNNDQKLTKLTALQEIIDIQKLKILLEIKGNNLPIGGEQREKERIFTKYSLDFSVFEKNTSQIIAYMFSDGIQDQFGGETGRKMGLMNLRDMIFDLAIHSKNMQKQKIFLEEKMQTWIGTKYFQLDDMTCLGLKIIF